MTVSRNKRLSEVSNERLELALDLAEILGDRSAMATLITEQSARYVLAAQKEALEDERDEAERAEKEGSNDDE